MIYVFNTSSCRVGAAFDGIELIIVAVAIKWTIYDDDDDENAGGAGKRNIRWLWWWWQWWWWWWCNNINYDDDDEYGDDDNDDDEDVSNIRTFCWSNKEQTSPLYFVNW